MTENNVQDMLDGIFEPWVGTSTETKQWIKALQAMVNSEVDISMTPQDFVSHFKGIKEGNASSPSGSILAITKSLQKRMHQIYKAS